MMRGKVFSSLASYFMMHIPVIRVLKWCVTCVVCLPCVYWLTVPCLCSLPMLAALCSLRAMCPVLTVPVCSPCPCAHRARVLTVPVCSPCPYAHRARVLTVPVCSPCPCAHRARVLTMPVCSPCTCACAQCWRRRTRDGWVRWRDVKPSSRTRRATLRRSLRSSTCVQHAHIKPTCPRRIPS